MPRVFFSSHLAKHVNADPAEVMGATVAEALTHVFLHRPELRGYVLDDQGRVRQHVMIYVDDAPLVDRDHQGDPLAIESEIHVLQALSGG